MLSRPVCALQCNPLQIYVGVRPGGACSRVTVERVSAWQRAGTHTYSEVRLRPTPRPPGCRFSYLSRAMDTPARALRSGLFQGIGGGRGAQLLGALIICRGLSWPLKGLRRRTWAPLTFFQTTTASRRACSHAGWPLSSLPASSWLSPSVACQFLNCGSALRPQLRRRAAMLRSRRRKLDQEGPAVAWDGAWRTGTKWRENARQLPNLFRWPGDAARFLKTPSCFVTCMHSFSFLSLLWCRCQYIQLERLTSTCQKGKNKTPSSQPTLTSHCQMVGRVQCRFSTRTLQPSYTRLPGSCNPLQFSRSRLASEVILGCMVAIVRVLLQSKCWQIQ